jgi:hypothetical protein
LMKGHRRFKEPKMSSRCAEAASFEKNIVKA